MVSFFCRFFLQKGELQHAMLCIFISLSLFSPTSIHSGCWIPSAGIHNMQAYPVCGLVPGNITPLYLVQNVNKNLQYQCPRWEHYRSMYQGAKVKTLSLNCPMEGRQGKMFTAHHIAWLQAQGPFQAGKLHLGLQSSTCARQFVNAPVQQNCCARQGIATLEGTVGLERVPTVEGCQACASIHLRPEWDRVYLLTTFYSHLELKWHPEVIIKAQLHWNSKRRKARGEPGFQADTAKVIRWWTCRRNGSFKPQRYPCCHIPKMRTISIQYNQSKFFHQWSSLNVIRWAFCRLLQKKKKVCI